MTSKTPGPRPNSAAEFAAFAAADDALPPAALTARIAQTVEQDLNPPAWRVFARLGLIQVLTGALVLLFCPQFGINLFPGMGLMSLFMRYGDAACMLGCGSVFLGLSGLCAALLLRPEEIRVIRASRPLQLGLMALLSAGVFVCLGEDLIVSMGVAWVAGSLVGGLSCLELAWLVRRRLR